MVLILLGILAIALPYATSFGIVRVLAWLIIFDGVTQLVRAFRAQSGGRAIWRFVVALLYIAGGISTRASNGSQWLLLHGIASPLLGLVIWRQWPISSLWAVGMLVGIGMIMTGVTRLMMALAVGKTEPA